MVLLAGEPGIGKTALADAISRDAGVAGFAVYWGACWEGDGAPAYWPWVQVLRAYARDRAPSELFEDLGASAALVARIVPEVAQRFLALPEDQPEADPEQARFRLFDGVTTALKNAAAQRPILIVIDDLHWADRASMLLLRFLSREIRDAAVLVLGTYREIEMTPGDPSAKIIAELARERLVVSGLGREEVGALIASTTGTDPADDLVAAVQRRTTGNPFFVKEVARLLAAQGRLGDAGAAVGLTIPEGVSDVVARRLARLSQRCVTVLEAASVLGPQFGLDVLEATAGISSADVLSALDEASAAGLVQPSPDRPARFRFAHALVQDAVHDGMASQRRVALHFAAGEALERLHGVAVDAHVAEIADHFIRGVPACDPARAAAYATRAGTRALGLYAYDEAVTQFRRALDMLALAGASAAERITHLLSLADALTRSGDLEQARATYVDVASLARDAGDAEALGHAALGLGTGLAGFEVRMFDTEQIALLREALEALPSEDSSLRAWLMARLSVARSFLDRRRDRERLSRDAVAMARRVGDPTAIAYALGSLCDTIAGPDHVEERIQLANEILGLSEEIRALGSAKTCGVPSCTICLCDPEMALLGRRFLVVAHLERGDVGAADAEIEAYARVAEHLRQPLYEWYLPLWRSTRALFKGALRESEDLLVDAAVLGERARSENAVLLVAASRAALSRIRNDIDGMVQVWRTALERYPALPASGAGPVAGLWIAIGNGDGDTARRLLREIAHSGIARIPKDSEYLSTLLYVVEAAWLLGDNSIPDSVSASLSPYADLFIVDGIGASVLSTVSHQLALLAALSGRVDDASAHFESALRAYGAVGALPLIARAQRDYATALLRGGGSLRRVQALIEASANGYAQLGLDDAAREVRDLLNAMPSEAIPIEGTFRKEGDFWSAGLGAAIVRMKDSKGLRDIAALLARPGAEIHASELYSARGAAGSESRDAPAALERDAGPILDDRARAEYKRTLADLDEELRDAEGSGDAERAARARASIEFISAELAAAFGLGGRARKAADPGERARKAVTERVRDSLGRIEKAEPSLGRHLRRSIRTGIFCSYRPDEKVIWNL